MPMLSSQSIFIKRLWEKMRAMSEQFDQQQMRQMFQDANPAVQLQVIQDLMLEEEDECKSAPDSGPSETK